MESRNEKSVISVPYVVYRDAIDDNRWVVKKLVVALIISVVLLFISNLAWLYCWNQYDYCTETVTTTADSEGDGVAVNITGGNGGVTTYGQSDSNQTDGYANEADRLEGNESSQTQSETVTNEPGF